MSTNPLYYDIAGIAALTATASLLDNGYLNIYSGTQPALDGSLTGTLLASLTFSPAAFATATASGGTVSAVANTIISATAVASGIPGYVALLQSNGTSVVATGAVGLSGADFSFSTLSITAGGTVSCSSFAITQPQA
jgi:hypothetical protein